MGLNVYIPGVGWYAVSGELVVLAIPAVVLIGSVIAAVVVGFRRLTAAKSAETLLRRR
jgi:hypothetical protein